MSQSNEKRDAFRARRLARRGRNNPEMNPLESVCPFCEAFIYPEPINETERNAPVLTAGCCCRTPYVIRVNMPAWESE